VDTDEEEITEEERELIREVRIYRCILREWITESAKMNDPGIDHSIRWGMADNARSQEQRIVKMLSYAKTSPKGEPRVNA
jgi:hypothetical protein